MIKKTFISSLVILMVSALLLFISGCFVLANPLYSDYPNYKTHYWITNKVYNLEDTIHVQDYILLHYHDTPFYRDDPSALPPYLTNDDYDDSVFTIVKQSLLKDTAKIYKFSDTIFNSKDILSKHHTFNSYINQKKINSAFFCKHISCSNSNGYILIPIIEIRHFKDVILTIAIFDKNKDLIFKKSIGNSINVPNSRFYYYDFVQNEHYERSKLSIANWDKIISDIMSDFK